VSERGTQAVAVDVSQWEERYSSDPEAWFFGKEPSELGRLTVHFARWLRPEERLRVLDLGCGEGRDAVYFAQQGYRVTAIDAAAAGIRKTERLVHERGVELADVRCGCVTEAPIAERWDIVFSGNCLQSLGSECPCFLQRLQKVAPAQCIHAIRVVTSAAEGFADRPELYRFSPGELLARYAGWRILYSSEDLLYVPHADGLASFASIIAVKS